MLLQFYFSSERDVTTDDLNGVGAAEGGGQLDVTFYGDIGGEHNVVVLIQKLNGAPQRVVPSRQRVAVYIEDGYNYG